MHLRLHYLIAIASTLVFAIPATPLTHNVSVTAQISVTNTKAEADRLFQQGVAQFRTGEFQAALQIYQQVLIIRQNFKDKLGIGETLDNIGEVYTSLGDYDKAMENLQQALTIRKELDEKVGIGETLNNIGFVYRQLGDYPKALELHQQALEIAKQIGKRVVEGEALHNIAALAAAQGDYNKALELYKQALAIRQEVGDKRDEGRTLNNIGGVYSSLGEYDRALQYYQQALAIRRTINDKAGVARLLSNIGLVYRQLSQYSQALEFYQQALPILQDMGDKASVGTTLNGIGVIYENLGQYDKSLQVYQQSLAIAKEIGDKVGIGNTFDNIGGISYSLGKYPQALQYYQQGLAIRNEIGDKNGVGNSLTNLGGVAYNLGQYPQALEFLQQALAIRKETGDKAGEGRALDAIGIIYESQNQYTKAIQYYQQALAISQQIGDKAGEGEALNHIGGIYTKFRNYSQAQQFLQQALAVRQKIGDKGGKGRTLNSIANVYYSQRNYAKALDFLQQSLTILQEIGDKAGEGIAFSNIGYLLEKQNQSTLAIIFYKQAVNLTESIRKDLKSLSIEQQKSFTDTVADTYRRLADLLLKQNRADEAKQVLDLLKIQELAEYLRNVRGNDRTAQGVDLLPQEAQISEKYVQVVQLGKELAQLRSIPDVDRTPAQQQRIAELERIEQQQKIEFNEFIRSPDVVALVQELNEKSKGENLNLANLDRVQQNLQQLPKSSVLIYPLILQDRLELVLVTPDSGPIHRPVAVKRQEIEKAIAQFREALQNPNSDATIPAKQLYNWLIKPIEKEIADSKAQTIIYAPDAQLRYIPLAALNDGKQWLVQRFAINYITAANLTDFKPKIPNNPRVLAGAFTTGNYSVPIGNRQLNFAGLPFAGREVNNLAATINNTIILLDTAFSPAAVLPRLNDYNIIHFATHAAFVTGQPEESFILFGDGSRVTLRDVETWSLPNADLVVLSACETGVGKQLGNGKEILGFGYQMQRIGAKAAIASLWSISDGGTQVLMNAFYAGLQKENITKAEALRQAQIALITGNSTVAVSEEQRGIAVRAVSQGSASVVSNRLNHPFYWAPFILIGNGF
ncbi:tetratricopeptide repeat protein [Planktothrix sp. FACHB-1355]|uniref:Tetratricopeptide repeat protein n=1 Tax=Aerosakkonema funiforme FACHB-1375 TaxID=2949571 RepID=A0A926VCT0_9CYAN|nr:MULTISPECIES: tetratricopeptide repeat protein [Oscillatoriales]MBD2181438.1 tetratricopeptide repeat protein [Aerosakkonema funiforme FACHB-1375]MBD3558705.1 tetratricopeptide repeat protein [Planktothrix sp. FACHB-1355]